MDGHLPAYQISRTEKFIQLSSKLIETYPSLIEFNKFLDWHLARVPTYFTPDSGDYYSLLSSDLEAPELIVDIGKVGVFPEVKVLYHIDKELMVVSLMSINLVSQS